jgi:hypothetical protein
MTGYRSASPSAPTSRICAPVRHRAVADPSSFRFLILGGDPPLTGSWDVVYGPNAGATEVVSTLEVLPERDPLYVSWIPLGDRKRILGVIPSWARTGPPGINMNSWPELSRYSDIAQFWYVPDGDEETVEVFEGAIRGFFDADPQAVLRHTATRFWADLSAAGASSPVLAEPAP